MIIKKLLTALFAIGMALSLAGCGGDAGSVNWQGTFYMEVDEYNTYIFDILETDEHGFNYKEIAVNTFGGGTATSSVTGGANITKNGAAENSNYQFSLRGDTLTVKVPEPDENTEMYAGTYTRGEPLPAEDESMDAGVEEADGNEENDNPDASTEVADPADGDETEEAAVTMMSHYYWNGDSEQDSFYFYPDGTFDYEDMDYDGNGARDTSSGTYSVDGNTLTFDSDSVLSIEDGGATLIDEQGEHFYLAEE
jgi:hypothetical protein